MEREQKASWIYIMTGVLVALVAISFARLSYGVVLPFMKDGLFISYKSAGLLGTITSLGYLVTVLFAGIISTKWGGKSTILLGLFLIIVGFFNLSIAPSYWYSSIFMFLLGVGTAFTFTPLIAILIEWYPHRKGLVIGCVNSSAGIGLLFVGILVPFLNEIYPETSWRLTWKIFGIISFLVFFKTLFFIKNPPLKETVIHPSLSTKQIYTNRNVVVVGLIYGIVGITFIVQSIFMMSFMLEAGLHQQFAGQLVAFNGMLSIFSSPVWGGVSDRLGRRNALILAMGLNLLSTIIPVLFPNAFGFTMNQLIQGVIATGMFTLIQALSTEQVSSRDTPVAFSYVTFYFAAGQFIGPTLAGWIIDYGGFKSTFFLSAICMAIGFYLTIKVSPGSKWETPLSTEI
jgi:MFS family permease